MAYDTKTDATTRRTDTAADQHSERAPLQYQPGFGNHFVSEAVPGALPLGQNSPQRPPNGLYAELISGTSFTTARNSEFKRATRALGSGVSGERRESSPVTTGKPCLALAIAFTTLPA